jgi:hypothetical protein
MKSSTYDDSSGMPATPEKALCGSVSAITLPEWDPTLEFSDSAIDRFIYSQEPAGEMEDEFRADFAAALQEAAAKERERIRAALMDMHRKTADHNYYHCAVVTLFGA